MFVTLVHPTCVLEAMDGHGSLGSPEPAILWTGQIQMSTGQPSPVVLTCACEFENYIVKLLVEFPATEKHKNWQSVESYSSVYGGKITHDPITMVFYCFFLVMSYTPIYFVVPVPTQAERPSHLLPLIHEHRKG
jgi:hypothetical protein